MKLWVGSHRQVWMQLRIILVATPTYSLLLQTHEVSLGIHQWLQTDLQTISEALANKLLKAHLYLGVLLRLIL